MSRKEDRGSKTKESQWGRLQRLRRVQQVGGKHSRGWIMGAGETVFLGREGTTASGLLRGVRPYKRFHCIEEQGSPWPWQDWAAWARLELDILLWALCSYTCIKPATATINQIVSKAPHSTYNTFKVSPPTYLPLIHPQSSHLCHTLSAPLASWLILSVPISGSCHLLFPLTWSDIFLLYIFMSSLIIVFRSLWNATSSDLHWHENLNFTSIALSSFIFHYFSSKYLPFTEYMKQ